MTPAEVRDGLKLLRNYYADRDGRPYPLNDAQWGVYIAGLSKFQPEQLRGACEQWMLSQKFFPKLNELLALLDPQVDVAGQAHLAWTTFERAVRTAGAYRGATFIDGAIGETVRQVFGTWAHACAYDADSPGWAIRRQTFLAVFPILQARSNGEPVTLAGRHRSLDPHVVGHVAGLPAPGARPELAEGEASHHEAASLVADIAARFTRRRLEQDVKAEVARKGMR